ncbi:MAG: hypothetical protein JSR00_08260 [Bacteroidetes bacterium]|nr:hypothetical protein [Bacteroidota bacterium]
MKPLLKIIFLLVLAIPVQAQVKYTTLYEVLKSALPDSTSKQNYVEWEKGISKNPFVKWNKNSPSKEEIYDDETSKVVDWQYSKTGTINLTVKGKKFNSANINISSKKLSGYNSLVVSLPMSENFTGGDITLFGTTGYKAELLNPEGDVKWYKVLLPQKKPAYICISEEYIAVLSNWVVVSVYFDDEEYLKIRDKLKQ